MTTAKQLAANRRNAGNSTGPRSPGGKKRAGQNALRHGLSVSAISTAAIDERIERLAKEISINEKIPLAAARPLAKAQFDLERVDRAKAALINHYYAFGDVEPQLLFRTRAQELRFVRAVIRKGLTIFPAPPDPSDTMPKDKAGRMAEAMCRAFRDLHKLDRYETRATARRDAALREIRKLLE